VVPARHRNDAAAEKLARAGIRVVQNRCMMPEHRRLIAAKGVRA
jgi:predicted CoA-binding protein